MSTPLSEPDAQAIAERCSEALSGARDELVAHGVDPEGLAEFAPSHRRLLIARPARMLPLGRVWRLGVLLLATEDDPPALYAAGRVTRSAERGRPNHQSLSREERREIAAAALRAGYPTGAPVNYASTRIPLDTAGVAALAGEAAGEGPLGVFDGELRVRWRRGAPLDPAPSLASYLAERVELLVDPPQGA